MSWPGELVQTASVPRVAALVSLNGNQAAQDADGLYAKHREMAFGEPQGFWPYVSKLVEFCNAKRSHSLRLFSTDLAFFCHEMPACYAPKANVSIQT